MEFWNIRAWRFIDSMLLAFWTEETISTEGLQLDVLGVSKEEWDWSTWSGLEEIRVIGYKIREKVRVRLHRAHGPL